MISTTTRLTATLALFTALVTGSAQAEDNSELQLMFVQTAAGIEVDRAAQKLRLKDVVPQVLYFSDRPDRVAGVQSHAVELPAQRRGDEIAVADARPARLVNGRDETAPLDIGEFDGDGLRHQ